MIFKFQASNRLNITHHNQTKQSIAGSLSPSQHNIYLSSQPSHSLSQIMVFTASGKEMTFSQSNLIKDDPAYDEESPPGKWFKPSESDTLDDKELKELPSRLRFFRRYNFSEFHRKGWGRPVNIIMYAMYILVAVLTTIDATTATTSAGFRRAGLACYCVWQVLTWVNSLYIFSSPRQVAAWTGTYKLLLFAMFQTGTLTLFFYSFKNVKLVTMNLEYALLIVMAGTIFVDQKMIDPSFKDLYYYYNSAISKDEVKDGVPPIAGISNSALLKIAANASKALGYSEEAGKAIQQVLECQRIREGRKEALDDWTYTINKLMHVVSFAPPFFVSKSKITSNQCRKLTCQMILYLRVYMDTGKIQETDTKRTAPLTLAEALVIMMKLSFQVPLAFFVGILPKSVYGIVNSALSPVATAKFTRGILFQDSAMAMNGLVMIIILMLISPLISLIGNYTEAYFTKKMISASRRKMLRSTLKGGTQFGEKFRPGKLIDSFSGQLLQVELYTIGFFVTIVPQIVSMASGVYVSAKAYPPAVYLFISLLPVILSVEYFEDRASRASAKKTETDAMLSGKVNSAVDCRDAIRAANASEWIAKDMKDLLDATDRTHFASFFRSGLSGNFIEIVSAIYITLILLPIGIAVVNQQIGLDIFNLVLAAMMSLVTPIALFGMFQKNTTQFGGAMQSVWELMDDSLDEEVSSSESSGTSTTLKKLTSSLSIKGIKFRYAAKLPDVIKGVNIGLSPGKYAVLCGESGSGKSTVLSLLMRFQKPSEGTVEWDGTDIYGASLDSFRENVSVMFQRTMIYQGTIRDNILFGQPEVPGAVEKAAQAAEIAQVIERLPDKYDTVIGGDALAGMSGGQLQRVCMARALYKNPSVLLLDEATSALDAETERSIIETLVKLRDTEGLTLVSVSHHPSTAVKADQIVVLEGGVIAEEGTYDDLVSRQGGIFRRMVEAGKEVQK